MRNATLYNVPLRSLEFYASPIYVPKPEKILRIYVINPKLRKADGLCRHRDGEGSLLKPPFLKERMLAHLNEMGILFLHFMTNRLIRRGLTFNFTAANVVLELTKINL